MEWNTITILTTTPGAEVVTGVLMDLGINGAVVEDKADVSINQRPEGRWDIIDEAIAQNMGDDVKVTAYISNDEKAGDTIIAIRSRIASIASMDLGFDTGKLSITIDSIDEEDWAAAWKTHFKTLRLGNHIVIKPTWCAHDPRPGDQIIEIDPAMAFGTGTHETTAMCVELIERYVNPGDTIIDVGTGSGILALTAAKLGAARVLAIDVDSVAVRVACENVARNGLSEKITVLSGDLLSGIDMTADIMIANIIADVIIDIADSARARIKEGGLFICSGIVTTRLADVTSALLTAGYSDLDIAEAGEWAAIAARR